jgi:predicted heme/steroid binding protein/uncharacterized membrane protein
MKEYTPAELADYNGEDGKPIYIAHDGKVYDVSESKMWRKGVHMKRHQAGHNLTADIQAAPHGTDVLERYPQVGTLKKVADERKIPKPIDWLISRFPFLRRHPHPMTVHFPIVFMLSTTVFNLLYLITGVKAFETTAFHCLGGGILLTVVAIVTGFYTWWLNYMAQMLKPVKTKIPLSILMLTVAVIIFIWRVMVPDVMDSLQGPGLIYLVLVLSLSVFITIIGWNGAAMTFPVEKE